MVVMWNEDMTSWAFFCGVVILRVASPDRRRLTADHIRRQGVLVVEILCQLQTIYISVIERVRSSGPYAFWFIFS